jgi:exodeoxyribonuclease VII small subunit
MTTPTNDAPTNAAPLDELTFEDLVERLEETVRRLEGDQLSLDDALQTYQEGVRLARAGHGRLEAAERRLEELVGKDEARPLDPDEVLREED